MWFKAKDYNCVCGKRGEYLNTWDETHKSNAFCTKCRDKAAARRKEQEQKSQSYKDKTHKV